MTVRKFLSASALIATGMLAGRVLGFLRETLIAAQFGGGDSANIAIALLLTPDFITSLLIGSAISAVFVPAFFERGKGRSLSLMWQSAMVFSVGFGLLALIISLFTHSGFIRIALYSLPVTAATGVFTAYLQYKGRFAAPAFSTALFNAIILGALWFLPPGLLMLAFAVVFASFARLFSNLTAYMRAGGNYKKLSTTKWELDLPLVVAYAQNTASNMLGILILYTPFALVALLSIGEFALFNYSFKLITFPAILIQTIVQMALLPWFVNIRGGSDSATSQAYGYSLQVAWVISLAVCLAVTIVSGPIAEVCFGHGKMTPQDVAIIGRMLSIGIWATPGVVLLSVLQQVFYAHQKQKPALIANAAMALLVIPLCWVGHIIAGTEGLLAGFVVAQFIPVLILSVLGRHYIEHSTRSIGAYIKMTVATFCVFMPLSAIYSMLDLPPVAEVMCGIIIGMLSLTAGLCLCRPISDKLHKLIAGL